MEKVEKIEDKQSFIPLELFVFNDFVKSLMLSRQRSHLIHSYTKSVLKFITESRMRHIIVYQETLEPNLDARFEEHISWLAELDTFASERIQLKKEINQFLEKQLKKNKGIKADWQLASELQSFVPLFTEYFDRAKCLAEGFAVKYEHLEVFLNFFDLSAIIATLEQMLEDGQHDGILNGLLKSKSGAQVLIRGLSALLSEESQSQKNFVTIATAASEQLQKILNDVNLRNQAELV